MPLDQLPTPTHPETMTGENDGAATLRAVFLCEDGDYRGARCELPTGETVEVHGRRTPFFAICRELDKRGYGDCRIEISTPEGTPSMRGLVKVMAGLRIEESDRGGLKQRKFEPFPGAGAVKERDLGYEGTPTPPGARTRLYGACNRAYPGGSMTLTAKQARFYRETYLQ